ncbi:hypothetical protein BAU15_00685 [Enterococcus sp. JM4C]|uniref:ATP-binding protein n=1 Tax=Candidatus Enterococcus huntleyi TaxID=1857217 RepID=UPI001379F217|nr:ATP-binding protein [Enterococcus sp. JM4C]KAF1299195.1 hypothetical protein BAU15_00685 [Enterococcus sp. JM4C]
MFVGRKNELQKLNELEKSTQFEFLTLYGRRRVGKTALLDEFVKGKKVIYYLAQQANDKTNLDDFSSVIYRYFGLPDSTPAFSRWDHALSFIYEQSTQMTEKIILIIDEYSYAAESNKSLGSMLQHTIDHQFKQSNIFLILCSSYISFVEKNVIGYNAPLYGRRSATMKLRPFDYKTTGELLGNISNVDKISYYATLGGIPFYLNLIRPEDSFESNIQRLFFELDGTLYAEPAILINEELREPANYNSILQAIATGNETSAQISQKTGIPATSLPRYLNTLIGMDFIEKLVPFGENLEKSKKGKYQMKDNLLRFWYRFVFFNRNMIERGLGSRLAEKKILSKENMSTFIGKPVFEEICLDYLNLQALDDKLDLFPTTFGTWWGTDSASRLPTDVDVVVSDEFDHKIILGECKWRNDFNAKEEFSKLTEKSRLFPNYQASYFFFMKQEPTVTVQELADEMQITLVTLNNLFD